MVYILFIFVIVDFSLRSLLVYSLIKKKMSIRIRNFILSWHTNVNKIQQNNTYSHINKELYGSMIKPMGSSSSTYTSWLAKGSLLQVSLNVWYILLFCFYCMKLIEIYTHTHLLLIFKSSFGRHKPQQQQERA